MEPQAINTNGVSITIRTMDTGYLMADREPDGVEVSVACRQCAGAELWPNPMYVEYYRKLTGAYGACAILAWHERMIVGFLPFLPRGCGFVLPHCLHYVEAEDACMVQRFSPVPQQDMASRDLKTHCLSVAPELRRQGLGSAMVRYLIAWARTHYWQRIGGWAFAQSSFGWLPDIAFWEKCGFSRGVATGWDEDITDPGFEYSLEL
jgi:GNAT superfamily N-acetyltransferase